MTDLYSHYYVDILRVHVVLPHYTVMLLALLLT